MTNIPVTDQDTYVHKTPTSLASDFVSNNKLNPYTHPIGFSLVAETFTRKQAITHAGAGGFFMGKPFAPFGALLAGAKTPLGAGAAGALASLSTDPDNVVSFGLQTALFSKAIGTRGGPKGGGIARGLRAAGLPKQAASLDRFVAGESRFNVIRGSLLGDLPDVGLYRPSKPAYSRLYRGLGPTGGLTTDWLKENAGAIKGKTTASSLFGKGESINIGKFLNRQAASPIITQAAGPGILPTRTDVSDQLLTSTVNKQWDSVSKVLNKYNTAVNKDWTSVMKNFDASKVKSMNVKETFDELYRAMGDAFPGTRQVNIMGNVPNKIATKQYGVGLAQGMGGGFTQDVTTSWKRGVVGTTTVPTYDRSLLKKMFTDSRYAMGARNLGVETLMGESYWRLFNKKIGATGGVFGELRMLTKGGRNAMFREVTKDVAKLSTGLTEGKQTIDLVKTLGSKREAGQFMRRVTEKGMATQFERVGKYTLKAKKGAMALTKTQQLDLALSQQSRLTSSIQSRAFSTFMWASLGYHFGKKAVGGILNAGAQAIEAGSKLHMQMTHLEFGSGQSLHTKQASTERTRAIQAIQSSGLNARSYLGKESMIYSQ